MTNTPPQQPSVTAPGVVAIVGRPNVGKSAIFNRILRRRLAIVHEESGVTRDRLVADAEWDGKRFELVDTGGITALDRGRTADEIEAETRHQAEIAIEAAAAVIFVVDVETGIVPLDAEVARLLHARGTRVFIAANKCDDPRRDDEAVAFERFGFPVFPVSALHNRGFEDLMRDVVAPLPDRPAASAAPPLRVVVVGRPNVGKSSYINRLLRSPRLIVSAVPGTTRDSIDIPFMIGSGPQARRYVLTDTAGMRRLGKVDGAVERFSLLRAETSICAADVVILMLDAAQGPTAHDKTIADLVLQHHKGCVIVVNKWDLMTLASEREYFAALQRAVPFLRWVPVVFVSSKSGYNIRQSVEHLDRVAAHVQTRLPTAALNRTLLAASERVHPPMLHGKRFKAFYATQVTANPIRIALFVNDTRCLPAAYREYLVAAFRGAFELEGAPILFELKARRKGHASSRA
jgi:GTPase